MDETIYDEKIEVRELTEVIEEIKEFQRNNIYCDTISDAIRVLIRRGLIESGYLKNKNKE